MYALFAPRIKRQKKVYVRDVLCVQQLLIHVCLTYARWSMFVEDIMSALSVELRAYIQHMYSAPLAIQILLYVHRRMF